MAAISAGPSSTPGHCPDPRAKRSEEGCPPSLSSGHPSFPPQDPEGSLRRPLERTERCPCQTQTVKGGRRRAVGSSSAMPFGSTLEAVFPPIQTCVPLSRLGNPRAFGLRVSHAHCRYFMPAFSTRMTPPYLTTRLLGDRALCYPDRGRRDLQRRSSRPPSARSSGVDLSSMYFRRKGSPRMRYYALTFWWMLPVLQIRRHGALTSFALSQHLGPLYTRLGCCPLDNGT